MACKIFKHKIEQQQHAIYQNEFKNIKLIVDNGNERLVQLRSSVKQK